MVTGGDIATDGLRVALCTYGRGVELVLGEDDGDFDEIWQGPLTKIALPQRQQGEAIAYRLDGAALLLTSEGSPMPLYEIPRLP